ncbi:unnamed protein product [Didymodactylos carnosus]|uniref:Mediator of RNA polymerase II transcription subunit 26 n=1 Tax=Didymodactylos carnosus TaxID=1234261 RepID=A0A813Q8I0_9BILA|nr:unnamed protein product [Didymodactylos carnosus]CAF3544637.1 unnamed protein product [Didymodactylos carnosus]
MMVCAFDRDKNDTHTADSYMSVCADDTLIYAALVIKEDAVLDIISQLENSQITKDQLQTTRLGREINDIRRKTTNREIAQRAKKLLRTWQDLLQNSTATTKSTISNDEQPPVNGDLTHYPHLSSTASTTVKTSSQPQHIDGGTGDSDNNTRDSLIDATFPTSSSHGALTSPVVAPAPISQPPIKLKIKITPPCTTTNDLQNPLAQHSTPASKGRKRRLEPSSSTDVQVQTKKPYINGRSYSTTTETSPQGAKRRKRAKQLDTTETVHYNTNSNIVTPFSSLPKLKTTQQLILEMQMKQPHVLSTQSPTINAILKNQIIDESLGDNNKVDYSALHHGRHLTTTTVSAATNHVTNFIDTTQLSQHYTKQTSWRKSMATTTPSHHQHGTLSTTTAWEGSSGGGSPSPASPPSSSSSSSSITNTANQWISSTPSIQSNTLIRSSIGQSGQSLLSSPKNTSTPPLCISSRNSNSSNTTANNRKRTVKVPKTRQKSLIPAISIPTSPPPSHVPSVEEIIQDLSLLCPYDNVKELVDAHQRKTLEKHQNENKTYDQLLDEQPQLFLVPIEQLYYVYNKQLDNNRTTQNIDDDSMTLSSTLSTVLPLKTYNNETFLALPYIDLQFGYDFQLDELIVNADTNG